MALKNSLTTENKEKNSIISTDTGEITLNAGIVRKNLVNGNGAVTDQEIMYFMGICKANKLNPFNKEIFLMKAGTYPATFIVSKDVFQKRADKNPNYDGKKAGIILLDKESGEVIYRDGSFYIKKKEELVGAWCEVYRKDHSQPERVEVTLDEYIGKKGNGEVNSMWSSKPATMIRKVAVVQALREAFTQDFGGLYVAEEVGYKEEEIQNNQVTNNEVEIIEVEEHVKETKEVQEVEPF